jgi:hypothetical protein
MKKILFVLITLSSGFLTNTGYAQEPIDTDTDNKYMIIAEDIAHGFIAYFDSMEAIVGDQIEDNILGKSQWKTRTLLNGDIEGLIHKLEGNDVTIIEFVLDEDLTLEDAKEAYKKYKDSLLEELEGMLEGEYELTTDEESDDYWFNAVCEIRPTGTMAGVIFLPSIEIELKTNYKEGYNILLELWFKKGF